jgi:acetyl-CoA acyltransferase 2
MGIEKDDIVFVEGARTAFGALNGGLKGVTATELGVVAAREALKRSHVEPEAVDHVIFGNVVQTCKDAPYLARHIGMSVGVPIEVPALTVNRLCASGLEAAVIGAQQLLLGDSTVVLVGGTENMTQCPHLIRGGRDGFRLGNVVVEDYVLVALTDQWNGLIMGLTAENLAEKYHISREEQDEFAHRSHSLAAESRENGRFAEEIVPVETRDRKGRSVVVDRDGLQEGGHGHCWELLRHQRWRGGVGDDHCRKGQRHGPEATGATGVVGQCGRRAGCDGHRAGGSQQESP